MFKLWIYPFVMCLLLVSLTKQVAGTRGRLLLDGEPDSVEIYKNHRLITADKSYYHLAAAGVLNESNIDGELLNYARDSNGQFNVENFRFNSCKWCHRAMKLHWFIDLQERVALHVYDNPHEIELATGPQVNQKTCGLLLDYTLHMVDKYYQHLVNSSEISIFNIMQSFGTPSPNIASASFIFPGDYRNCVENKLNVMRKELIELADKNKVDKFFEQPEEINLTLRQSISFFINKYFGSLFGAVQLRNRNDDNELVKNHSKQIRLIPNRYCLAGLRFKHWKKSPFHDRNIAIRSATCLPDYCDSKSLSLFHDKIKRLIEVQLPEFYHGFYIENLYCLPDENSKFRDPFNYTDSIFFIVFNSIWFSVTIVATVITKIKPIDRRNSKFHIDKKYSQSSVILNLLNSWNFKMNYKIFFEGKEDVVKVKTRGDDKQQAMKKDNLSSKKVFNRVDFKFIEGIKVFGSFSTIVAHICTVSLVSGWNPIVADELISKSLLAMIVMITPNVVNIFFVITGLMTAHLLFKVPRESLEKANFWFKYIIYRYLRIVPLFALTHWFLQSYFRFLSFGPFWDYGTSNSAWQKVCENDSIWGIIFPIANMKSPSRQCNHVGWYLSNDVQAALITPFFMILFVRSALVGYISTLLLIFALIANHIRYYLEQPLFSRGGLEISIMTLPQVTDDSSEGYVKPQYRLISYLIGICAGHLLHSYEIGKIKRWPKSFIYMVNISICWLISVFVFLPYMIQYLPLHNQQLVHSMGAILSGTVHGITSFVTAGFLLLFCTNNYPTLGFLLSKRIFQVLASASLSTLVIHIPIIYYHANTMRSLPELNFHNFVATCFIQIIESLIISAVIHVLYEIPLRRFFVKLLFMISPSKQESKEVKEVGQESVGKKMD